MNPLSPSSWGRVGALALLATALSVPASSSLAGTLCAIPRAAGATVYTNIPTNDGSCARSSFTFSSTARSTPMLIRSASEPRFDSMIQSWASRYNVSPNLVHAVVSAESAYNPGAVSRTGARGLMQLMPGTAKRYGVTNSFDPDQNIRGGVAHLRDLLDTYGGDTRLAVAAYNAGAGAVDKYSGVPPYKETRQYVTRVLGKLKGSSSTAKTASSAPVSDPVRKVVDASGTISLVN